MHRYKITLSLLEKNTFIEANKVCYVTLDDDIIHPIGTCTLEKDSEHIYGILDLNQPLDPELFIYYQFSKPGPNVTWFQGLRFLSKMDGKEPTKQVKECLG